MLLDIVAPHSLGDYRLHLRFENGVEGVVDLAQSLSFQRIFAPSGVPAGRTAGSASTLSASEAV